MISVTTWTNHDCGCETSDTGWAILTSSCLIHFSLIPLRDRERNRRHAGYQYGPWHPYECLA